MSSSSEDDSKDDYSRPAASSWADPNGTTTGEKNEKLVIVKDEEIGMIPDLKNLYGGKEDKRGRFTWQVKHSRLPRRDNSS